MITFVPYVVPVVTPKGDGFLIYVESGYWLENDVWTCVLKDGGLVLHFQSIDCKIFQNLTYGINKGETKEGPSNISEIARRMQSP